MSYQAPLFIAAALYLYRYLVKSVRYCSRAGTPNLENYTGKERTKIASDIHYQLARKEFFWITKLSLELGLFKTYSIPSISKILAATKEFENFPGKRYDDTDLLILEMFRCPVFIGDATTDTDEFKRSQTALKRLNYIHSQYPIKNDDMLYTLCVFILEPIRWIKRYGWRSLTANEEQAVYESWSHTGTQMGIENIPGDLKSLAQFYDEYEAKHVRFHQDNVIVAKMTMKLFLSKIPNFLKPLVQKVIEALLPNHVNKAFGFQKGNSFLVSFLDLFLRFRSVLIRNWFLPRTKSVNRTPDTSTNGVFIPTFHPYDKTYKDGYRIEDLGPQKLKKGALLHACPHYRK